MSKIKHGSAALAQCARRDHWSYEHRGFGYVRAQTPSAASGPNVIVILARVRCVVQRDGAMVC